MRLLQLLHSLNLTGKVRYIIKLAFCEIDEYQNSSPGPKYDTFGIGIKNKNKTFSIGKSNRYNINHGIEKTPGPTEYNPEKKKNEKKFTIPKN